MPKLPTYTAELGALPISGGRRASAGDFGAGIGAEVQRAGHAGAQVYEDIKNADARKVVVERSNIVTKYAARLDAAVTSGEDLDKIKEEMNNELSKIGEGLSTPHGMDALEIATATTNQMYDAQANAIKSRRAGAEAKLQAGTLLRNVTGILATNPGYLPFAEDEVAAFVLTLGGKVDPTVAAGIGDALQEQLHTTAAMSAARLTPEATKQALAEGKWKLTGEQALQVQAEADRTIRARRVDAEYQRTLDERRKDEANDTARRGLYQGLREGSVTENDILRNMDLKPATVEHLINVMEQMAKDKTTKDVRTDPLLFNRLREAIDAEPGQPGRIVDPQRVWMAYGKGLSQDDATFLENRIYANRDITGQTLASEVNKTISLLSKELDKSNLLTIDPLGPTRVMRFSQYVNEQIEKARKDPKADPRELLNPNSPKYVGHAVPRFLSGAQAAQRDIARDVDKALRPKDRKPLEDIFGK